MSMKMKQSQQHNPKKSTSYSTPKSTFEADDEDEAEPAASSEKPTSKSTSEFDDEEEGSS